MASLVSCPKCQTQIRKDEQAEVSGVLVCPGCQAKLKLKPAQREDESLALQSIPIKPAEPSSKKKFVN